METRRILTFIFSFLLLGAFIFVVAWGVINFNAVKVGLSGSGLYTQEDIKKSYEDGYNKALVDKEDYETLIAEYRGSIATLTDSISQLNLRITSLTNSNRDYATEVASLVTNKETLENEILLLRADNLILQSEIASLQSRISNLSEEIAEIPSLYSQIAILQESVSNMQATIDYYEEHIDSLLNENEAVVTFEYDGSVYDVKVINKGETVSIDSPESTNYIIFNGWKLNNSFVDLSNYVVTENVRFVADLTYRYDVNFMLDNSVYDYQIVTKGNFAILPDSPNDENIVFDGWTIDGENIVDVTSYPIVSNTTFIARITKYYIVSYSSYANYNNNRLFSGYQDEVVYVGNYASGVTPALNESYEVNGFAGNSIRVKPKFLGWHKPSSTEIIDLSTYPITENTVLEASFSYYIDVNFYTNDYFYYYPNNNGLSQYSIDPEHNRTSSNVVYSNLSVLSGENLSAPENPTKANCEFCGWYYISYDLPYSYSFHKILPDELGNLSCDFVYNLYALFKPLGFCSSSTSGAIYSWDFLINSGYLSVSNGTLSRPNNNVRLQDSSNIDLSLCKILVIPEGITSISSDHLFGIFANLTSLEFLCLPSSLEVIGSLAFEGCSSLYSVYIPQNVSSIEGYAFAKCKNVARIEVDWNNNYYFSNDNCLLDNNNTLVLGCKNSIIPSNVTTILGFTGGITEFVVPDFITTIGSYAFYGCEDLTQIIIPNSVTTIQEGGVFILSLPQGQLTIYCKAPSKPNGWDTYWNMGNYSVVWNYSN